MITCFLHNRHKLLSKRNYKMGNDGIIHILNSSLDCTVKKKKNFSNASDSIVLETARKKCGQNWYIDRYKVANCFS